MKYNLFNRSASHEGWRTVTFFAFFKKGGDVYGYNKRSNADGSFQH